MVKVKSSIRTLDHAKVEFMQMHVTGRLVHVGTYLGEQ